VVRLSQVEGDLDNSTKSWADEPPDNHCRGLGWENLSHFRHAIQFSNTSSREVAPPINFGQFVVANFNPPILWARMELTNAILAGERRCGKRVSLRTIRWDHSDELCVGKLAGICIAIFGYGGMQRSIGCVSAIAFHVAGVRLGRARLDY
jgi:hypothetical protein